MIGGFADHVKGVFGVRTISEEIASGSNKAREETIDMASVGEEKIEQAVQSNIANIVHCGGKSNDAVTTEKSTVISQNRRRRLSRRSESMDNDTLIIAQSEDDIVTFGAEDTILIVKGGLIEGQVTVQEIADAINDVRVEKDDANETAEVFAKLYGGRRRSSVLRDRQLESAAAELGDRMI